MLRGATPSCARRRMSADSPTVQIEPGAVNESTIKEVYRNLLVLYGTRAGEQALDRDFGIDANINDCPQESAQALLAAEYIRKTQRYEPRARVVRVEWTPFRYIPNRAARLSRAAPVEVFSSSIRPLASMYCIVWYSTRANALISSLLESASTGAMTPKVVIQIG